VLTDPPYGLTANKWDNRLDMAAWWSEIHRVCHIAVLTASQPFTAIAVCANLANFKHEWIWRKNRGSNFANTVREPFKEHESVLVFATKPWKYNPQREGRRGSGLERAAYKVAWAPGGSNYREFQPTDPRELTDDRVPSSVQDFNTETGLHPTQKPLKLMLYMVSTYSEPGAVILDPFMGSGTTVRAAKDLGRKAIGIEIEEKYCEIAAKRLSQEVLCFE
jgi:site-specific DNA-methyltransferase (adenine-specific)